MYGAYYFQLINKILPNKIAIILCGIITYFYYIDNDLIFTIKAMLIIMLYMYCRVCHICCDMHKLVNDIWKTTYINSKDSSNFDIAKLITNKTYVDLDKALPILMEQDNIEIAQLIIDNGAYDVRNALISAIKHDRIDFLELLLKQLKSDFDLNQELIVAIKLNKINIVNIIIEKSKINMNNPIDINNAIVISLESRNDDIREYLVNINLENASKSGNKKSVDDMITLGATNVNNSLITAINNNHYDIMKTLFENKEIKFKPFNINEALICSLKCTKPYEYVKYLVNKGASNIDDVTRYPCDCITTKKFLKDKNQVNHLNKSLIISVENGNIELAKHLIVSGANNFNECLIIAIENGYIDLVKHLIIKGSDNIDEAKILATEKKFDKILEVLNTIFIKIKVKPAK